MSNTPSDAEIIMLAVESGVSVRTGKGAVKLARAVLAKWGQPAQAAEPVAWLRNTTDPQPHAVTNLKYRSAVDAKAGVEYIPVFAAPQPVAREPLTDEHIRAMLNKHPPEDVCGWSYRMGIEDAELHHGIKGGQS